MSAVRHLAAGLGRWYQRTGSGYNVPYYQGRLIYSASEWDVSASRYDAMGIEKGKIAHRIVGTGDLCQGLGKAAVMQGP